MAARGPRTSALVAGVVRLDASAAVDGEIRSLAGRIEAAVPLFVRGTSQLAPGQEAAIAGLMADVGQLNALLEAAARRARITIVGHTDTDGAPLANVPLSLARAERLRAALVPGPSRA